MDQIAPLLDGFARAAPAEQAVVMAALLAAGATLLAACPSPVRRARPKDAARAARPSRATTRPQA